MKEYVCPATSLLTSGKYDEMTSGRKQTTGRSPHLLYVWSIKIISKQSPEARRPLRHNSICYMKNVKDRLARVQTFCAMALCVILTCGFVSCSDDDDEKSGDSSIVGTWLLSLPDEDGEVWYCQYHFKSDGTFEGKDWGESGVYEEPANYEFTGNWSTDGDKLTLKFQGDSSETYRYSLDGDKLIIYDYEEPGPNVFVRR